MSMSTSSGRVFSARCTASSPRAVIPTTVCPNLHNCPRMSLATTRLSSTMSILAGVIQWFPTIRGVETYCEGCSAITPQSYRAMKFVYQVTNQLQTQGISVIGVEIGRKANAIIHDSQGTLPLIQTLQLNAHAARPAIGEGVHQSVRHQLIDD